MKVLIRTVKEYDLDDISKHLLVVGDLSGDCFNCKEFGLNYSSIKSCPKCHTEFRYIASRKSNNLSSKIMTTLHKKRPDLVYIEFSDLKVHKNREKAKDFLS